jgi:hypothetical protein
MEDPMTIQNHKRLVASLILALATTAAQSRADTPNWRVVLAEQSSAAVALPGLPSAGIGIFRPGPDVSAGGKLGAILQLAGDANEQLWTELANFSYSAIARTLVGDASGPNRSLAEANHQFDAIYQPAPGNSSGVQFFAARAGDPAVSTSRSTGIWRNANGVNTEVARFDSDGALGPNLGAGQRYGSNLFLTNLHALSDNGLLIDGYIERAGASSLEVIARHAGGPAQTCSVTENSSAAFAPGVFPAPDRFTTFLTAASSLQGEVYAAGTAQAVSGGARIEGLFLFCQGAPVKIALQSAVNDFGPGFGAAFFTSFHKLIAPGNAGTVFYGGQGRLSGALDAAGFKGLFYFDGTRSKPLTLQGAQFQYGPNVPGYRFVYTGQLNDFGNLEPKAAGRFALIEANIETDTGTDERTGLFRVGAAGRVDPLALLGSNTFAPQPGWVFSAFALTEIFANGDVALLAEIQNSATSAREMGLWRMRLNKPMERLLGPGSIVQVPTSSGTSSMAISEVLRRTQILEPLNGLTQDFTGDDHWASPDGTTMVAALLPLGGGGATRRVFLRAALFNPDVDFQDGFE